MKAIPISEIDSKIEVLTGLRYNDEMNKIFDAQLRILKEIKQKAIPAYTLEEATALKHGIRDLQDAYQNVIEESIPISKIDEKIKELEEIMDIIEPYDHPEFLYEHKEKLRDWYIKLKDLKK